jgi:hypothetical protein
MYWDNTPAYPFWKVEPFIAKKNSSFFPNLLILLTLAQTDYFLFPML